MVPESGAKYGGEAVYNEVILLISCVLCFDNALSGCSIYICTFLLFQG
jgi:hypothetical protein